MFLIVNLGKLNNCLRRLQ